MNRKQSKAFHSTLSTFDVKANPYRLTGTRCLIAHEKDIRQAVNKGYNSKQIAIAMRKIENSPFQREEVGMLELGTCIQYVLQIRSELNIRKPNF